MMDEDDDIICIPRKRLRSSLSGEKINYTERRPRKRKFTINHLPPEILNKVFDFISSHDLEKSVRLVNHNFYEISKSVMHRRFLSLDRRLSKLYKCTYNKLKESRPLRIKIRTMDLVHYVEILVNQYNMLRASLWRYMKNGSNGLCNCVCSGRLLDLFEDVMYKIHRRPLSLRVIFHRCLDIDKLCYLVRTYISQFEIMVERKVNENCYVSGTKLCDILDCGIFTKRRIISEKYENGLCHLKVKYRFRNAWFNTCWVNGRKNTYTWSEDQRLMYSRLRRLILAHNTFCSERNVASLKSHIHPLRKSYYRPTFSAYAATGEYGDRKYYFGCMLPGSYHPHMHLNSRALPIKEEKTLILDVTVNISCPIEQTPLFIYKNHCMDLETVHSKKRKMKKSTRAQTSRFFMDIEFKCELAKQTEYPSIFHFEVSENNRINMLNKIYRV